LPALAGVQQDAAGSAAMAEQAFMVTTIGWTIAANLALAAQAQSQPGGIALFLPLILIMVIFYFLMILPAQRRQKKVTEMLKGLKTGDKIITNSGIYGTIVGMEDDSVQLRIAEQVKIKLARSAIAGLQAEPPKES
jgi:preprotein translocase subunit YajC